MCYYETNSSSLNPLTKLFREITATSTWQEAQETKEVVNLFWIKLINALIWGYQYFFVSS